MGDRPFCKPVHLRLHDSGKFQARSAWEALEYLDLYWGAPKCVHYRRAHKLCQNAIDGWTTSEEALSALIDAARRAGLLASGGAPNKVRTLELRT